jgi:DNA repair photolyase
VTTLYKHAASVTSQVYFCAAPIRLDAYDSCQFGCTYCFSRKRSRISASRGAHEANADAFAARLARVARGEIHSALDEFLQRRVPIQLGGLQDPFSPREKTRQVTFALLRALRDAAYPTLISTKGALFLEERYLSLLEEMNVVVRVSAAAISEDARRIIERGCDPYAETLKKFEILAQRGIRSALRIQPVFPSFETTALDMATQAVAAGAQQVTFEYLKLPSEDVRAEMRSAERAIGFDVTARMKELGVRKIGPDWSLSVDVKRPFVRQARAHCRALKVRFGAGDTEFIPWSDGDGCCGSSDVFPDRAAQFTTNFVGAIKKALHTPSKEVRFDSLLTEWSPQLSVGNYMDSRARIQPGTSAQANDWLALLARRWNGEVGSPYAPDFFDGVTATAAIDAHGMRIYDASALALELT